MSGDKIIGCSCSDCAFFDYEESYDGEDEYQFFMCAKGNGEHIGWNAAPCEFFETEVMRNDG